MALFESYERREKQILAVINQYGINTIEECADVCKAKGLDIYTIISKAFSQSASRTLAGHTS